MGLMQIWRMLMARRSLILALIALGAIAGAVVAKLMPNQYEARSRLVLNPLKPDPVTGVSLPQRGLESYVQAQIELIRDERVTGAVVDYFGWEKSPELQQEYRNREGDQSLNLRQWLAKSVSENTEVSLVQNSPILEIVYTSTSPQTARRGADAVRDAFVAQTLQVKRQDAARNAQWFQKQTTDLKQRLSQAEARKSKFEQDNKIILQDDNVDSESAKLKALASSAPLVPMPSMSFGGPASSPSAAQLAGVDAQLASARRTLGPNHPDIIALQQQRVALASAASREMAAARTASRPAASGPSISSMISAQTQKVLAQRGLVGQAQQLAGDVMVLREQVTKTAQRAAEFQLQAQSTETGFDSLGAAATPQKPVTLGVALFVLGGLVVGLGLGLVLALLLEILFRRVRGAEDLYIDGLPVIGEMNRDADSAQGQGLLHWLGLRKMDHLPV